MDFQLQEAYTGSFTYTRRLGAALQSRTSSCFSSRLLLDSHQCPSPSISVQCHACTQDNLYKQSDLSSCPVYRSQTPSSQVLTVLDKKTLVRAHTTLGHSDPTGFRISHTSTLVQQAISSSRSPPCFFPRCVTNRMGGLLADSSSLRSVVTSRVLPTYLAGTGKDTIGLTSVEPQWHNRLFEWVYCDNSTVVAYFRKQRGTDSISLFNKTLELCYLLDQFAILLFPHLPGARNVTADTLSRINSPSPTEWSIPKETLHNLFSVLVTS